MCLDELDPSTNSEVEVESIFHAVSIHLINSITLLELLKAYSKGELEPGLLRRDRKCDASAHRDKPMSRVQWLNAQARQVDMAGNTV
jgi:hypothetical protein